MMIMMMMMMMMMVMMMLMMMMIDEVLFFCVTRQDAGAGLQGQRPRVHLATGRKSTGPKARESAAWSKMARPFFVISPHGTVVPQPHHSQKSSCGKKT